MAENVELFERLSRIEQGVARIDERTGSMAETHKDHEQRIRDLERESDKRKGVLAAVSSLGGIIGAGVMWILKAIFGGGQ